MTIEEFDKTGFTGGMKAKYRGVIYDVCSVEFNEKLIGLDTVEDDENDVIIWVRCENAELL